MCRLSSIGTTIEVDEGDIMTQPLSVLGAGLHTASFAVQNAGRGGAEHGVDADQMVISGSITTRMAVMIQPAMLP